MFFPDTINVPPRAEYQSVTESEIILRRVLRSAPQDLWLDTIRRTQGPQHDGLIYWMLNQTECDFAVACHAFYRSNPAQHLDNPRPLPSRPGPEDIFALVLLNWDTGSYRTHRLMVDPVDANPRMVARINQKVMARPSGSLPFRIPQKFLTPVGGTPMSVPQYLSADNARHLWPVYNDLGLKVAKTPPGIARQMARAKSLLIKIKRGSGLP